MSSDDLAVSLPLISFRPDLVAAAKAEPGNVAVRAEFTKVEELLKAEAKKVISWPLVCSYDMLTGNMIVGKGRKRHPYLRPRAIHLVCHTLPTTRAYQHHR